MADDMTTFDPNRSFGFLISDVARLLRKIFDRRAQELGLSRAQWSALAHLHCREGIKQAELAERLEIEPISLARLIDRLEKGGWVERRSDPADRRVRRLYLTAKARPMLDRMRALAQEVRAEATAGLSEDDRQRFLATLLHLKANLLAIDAAASAEEAKRDKAAAGA